TREAPAEEARRRHRILLGAGLMSVRSRRTRGRASLQARPLSSAPVLRRTDQCPEGRRQTRREGRGLDARGRRCVSPRLPTSRGAERNGVKRDAPAVGGPSGGATRRIGLAHEAAGDQRGGLDGGGDEEGGGKAAGPVDGTAEDAGGG